MVTSKSVTALLTTLRHLRELRLAHCTQIDDSAFMSLPPTMTFDSLRILDLTACENVRDESVEKIVQAAPRLRNLVLAKCRFITDRSVMAICRLGKNLHYVHLGHCSNISDVAVIALVKSCNRIRYIDLACCNRLTDHSVQQLATLPKLRRIGLVKCQAITDQSILALARPRASAHHHHSGCHSNSSSSLERVHLSYCVQLKMDVCITRAMSLESVNANIFFHQGIHALLNHCPRLTHLSLTGVQEFLHESLTTFCREAPPEFTQQQRDVFCVFSGDGVTRLREYLNKNKASYPEETEATMYDDDEELDGDGDGDEGRMAGMMNAAVINDDDDEFLDVSTLNT